jgi:hypothetical protein
MDTVKIPLHNDNGTQSVVRCPADNQYHHAHKSADGRRFCGKCLAEGK